MSKDNSKMSDVISGDTVDGESCCFISSKQNKSEEIGKELDGGNGIVSSQETKSE